MSRESKLKIINVFDIGNIDRFKYLNNKISKHAIFNE